MLSFDPGVNTVLRFSPEEHNVQKIQTLQLKQSRGFRALRAAAALTVNLPEFRTTMETHPWLCL